MPKLNFRDCIPYAFGPLLAASRRPDLASRLKLLPPSTDIRDEQFQRFGMFKKVSESALPLPNGGFFLRFRNGDDTCIAFSSYVDDVDLDRDLDQWLGANEAIIERVDQAAFLFLVYHAAPYFSIKPTYKNRRRALDVLRIVEGENYQGHSVDDLIDYFHPAYVITLPRDSLLDEIDDFALCSELVSMVPDLRYPVIDNEMASALHGLVGYNVIKSENIFRSLTSTSCRYAYLEIFRILESMLHVPWMISLKDDLGVQVELSVLYGSLREKLFWRESKGGSIELVFKNLNGDAELLMEEKKITAFSGIEFDSREFCRSSVGRRIYKIRNQLVHPEDFTDRSELQVSEVEFAKLCKYLILIVTKVFDNLPQNSIRLAR